MNLATIDEAQCFALTLSINRRDTRYERHQGIMPAYDEARHARC
jgi:hypothetical protein